MLKDLLTEARRTRPTVDALLNHGQQVLKDSWSISLQVDLAYLAFQWNGYINCLNRHRQRRNHICGEKEELLVQYGDKVQSFSQWRIYLHEYINSVKGSNSHFAPYLSKGDKSKCTCSKSRKEPSENFLEDFSNLDFSSEVRSSFNKMSHYSPKLSESRESRESLLLLKLSQLDRSPIGDSPSKDLLAKYGSSSSINTINEDEFLSDNPSEPKRRRLTYEDTPSSISSQMSSQVSSRAHSPMLDSFDDSMCSTPGNSPSATLKEQFKKRYRKDELWAAIESNYKYLMDKEIIEACRTTESEGDEVDSTQNVSFGEFLKQYRELVDWLNHIQEATQERARSLSLSEKYLNQSFHEEMLQRSPRHKLLNEYSVELQQRHPQLKDEITTFLQLLNSQWEAVEKAIAPFSQDQDPETMLRDLEDDLKLLRKWLDGVEDQLRSLGIKEWDLGELEYKLQEHKVLQREIESHSRIVSAVLKLSERLQNDTEAFGHATQRDSLELSALNLERRWHAIWLQSLEWQCRLEDAINRRKGIFTGGPYFDFPNNFGTLKDQYEEDDVHNVTASSGDDSFTLNIRSDFVHSPQQCDSSSSLTPDSGNRSGKDSAVASESELKASDMSENYADLSVSTGSDSDRDFHRHMKVRLDSKDIGYGSESQSNDELELRYRGITFSGINSRVHRQSTRSGDSNVSCQMANVGTESTEEKTNPDESELSRSVENSEFLRDLKDVLEEPGREDIKYLIDHADQMVQQRSSRGTFSPKKQKADSSLKSENRFAGESTEESSFKSSSDAGPEKVDVGVGTVESSCDASGEDTTDSDKKESFSTASDDGGEDTLFDSVIGEEYTSDEKSRDHATLPRLYDTNSLHRQIKGKRRDRPWSVVELPNIEGDMGFKPFSTSESAIDKLGSNFSDSDAPKKISPFVPAKLSSSPRHSPRHRRRAHCIQRTFSANESGTVQSRPGAKRKLHLTTRSGINSGTKSGTVSTDNCSSGEEDNTLLLRSSDSGSLMSALQSARFRSSGSSMSGSDTADEFETPPSDVISEQDDPNDAASFSENAWDNYQAPLYPTGSEDPPEEPLNWEPMDEMEFDDEFGLPQSTIIASILAHRSEPQSKKSPKLIHHSKAGNFDDSDSDIEDLHHVLAESRTQLKLADKSLRKKRKDPLGTGLYLNPGKYGELQATCDTNIRCLESINQHIVSADVNEEDLQTIQDLLYQWEKLHALASERRGQSQELKQIYQTLQMVQAGLEEGVPALEKAKFQNLEDLRMTAEELQEKQRLLKEQRLLCEEVRMAVNAFASQNSTINMESVYKQLDEADSKLLSTWQCCSKRLGELDHFDQVWQNYNETRKELEFLLTQERELLQRLSFHQEMEMEGNREEVERDLKKLVNSLAEYEEKMIALQNLRAELMDVSDEETKLYLTAGIADIRNQLLVARKQCHDIMMMSSGQGQEKMVVEEEMVTPQKMDIVDAVAPQLPAEEKEGTVRTKKQTAKPKSKREPRMKDDAAPSWLKYFPIQAVALAVFLGLLYLIDPEFLYKMVNFRFTPELKYVNGPPPV